MQNDMIAWAMLKGIIMSHHSAVNTLLNKNPMQTNRHMPVNNVPIVFM
jgi:hypothetical protein